MIFDYNNIPDGKIKSKMHFDAFKNFCMSNKARVKRYKKRGRML